MNDFQFGFIAVLQCVTIVLIALLRNIIRREKQ